MTAAEQDPPTTSEVTVEQPVADPKKPTMEVKVYAPFQVIFEGKAYSVSAANATGPFSVLPRHHNFISMLVPSMLVVDAPEGKKKIKVRRALMHIKSHEVEVYLDV